MSSETKELSEASDVVSEMVSRSRSDLLESLSNGLPIELKNLKKCPKCHRPAMEAEIAELGKCSLCRQVELTHTQPLSTQGDIPRENDAPMSTSNRKSG